MLGFGFIGLCRAFFRDLRFPRPARAQGPGVAAGARRLVLATGESHSVREFVEIAFSHVGRHIDWRGKGVEEKGVDAKTGHALVEIDPRHFRPAEVRFLCGDSTKARENLGWTSEISFAGMVEEMVRTDLARLRER